MSVGVFVGLQLPGVCDPVFRVDLTFSSACFYKRVFAGNLGLKLLCKGAVSRWGGLRQWGRCRVLRDPLWGVPEQGDVAVGQLQPGLLRQNHPALLHSRA